MALSTQTVEFFLQGGVKTSH